MAVYLRLLGGARIDAAGAPARGRAAHRRRLALLAILATAPSGRRSRERVVALLWPDNSSEGGRRLLSEALHVIRRELGDATILSVGDELCLDPAAVGSDVSDFRQAIAAGDLERAVALYHGPFLDGWFVAGSNEFDEWAERERATLAAEYASALEALAVRAEGCQRWTAAAEHWRACAQLSPDSPRAALRLARALDAAGERAAAIRAVAAHIQYMEGEGYPVDREVQQFRDRLRAEPPGADEHRFEPAREITTIGAGPPPRDEIFAAQPVAAVVGAPVRNTRRMPLLLWSAAGLALLSGLAVWRRTSSEAMPTARGSVASLDPNRIAVLYFEDQGQEDVGYLGEGLTEKLIEELSSVPVLRVVPRSSVKYYHDLPQAPPLDTIASALGAGTIVEGAIQRAGNRVRVTVSLVDARTNTTVGTRTVERVIDERVVFALEDEIGAQVASFLRKQLGEEIRLRAPRSGTTSGMAQALLLQGEHARKVATSIVALGTAADVEAAEHSFFVADSLFARAEAADSRWIAPIVMRGWVARDRAKLDPDSIAARRLREALAHADRALQRDSANAAALELRGTVRWDLALRPHTLTNQRDARLAEADLRAALAHDSTLASAAATLSQLLRATGTTRQDLLAANDLARRAYQMDAYLAYSSDVISQLYRATKALGQADSAQAWCNRGRLLAPSDWRFVECNLALMRLDLAHARPREAWRLVDELSRMDPAEKAIATGRPYSPIYRQLVAAAVSAAAGQRDSARAVLFRALREVADDDELRIDIKHDETLVRLALGERAAAFAALSDYLAHRPQFRRLVLQDFAYRQFGLDSASLSAALQARAAVPE